MKIKALSLWQPWASLVAVEAKWYETRSWSTDYRGLLAIHATKREPTGDDIDSWIAGTLIRKGERPLRLPLGAVLCVCRLVDVARTELELTRHDGDVRFKMDEYHFGNYSPGRFAWQLEMVHRFADPIPATGRQGLWEWNCPVDLK